MKRGGDQEAGGAVGEHGGIADDDHLLHRKLCCTSSCRVAEETLSAGATAPDLGGQGRGGGRGGRGRGRGSPVGGRGAAYNALLDMQWGPTTFPMSMQVSLSGFLWEQLSALWS